MQTFPVTMLSVCKPATYLVPYGFGQDIFCLLIANRKGFRLGHSSLERGWNRFPFLQCISSRFQHHLCMYCRQAGHLKTSCPICPNSSSSKAVSVSVQSNCSSSCVKTPVKITVQDRTISTSALLDLGAAGNFLSHEFCSTT